MRGFVQGVGYRASARHEALRLGLAGWVRNLPGGEVEAEAVGDAAAVEAFVDWCRRGPPSAEVDEVTVLAQGAAAAPRPSTFAIVR